MNLKNRIELHLNYPQSKFLLAKDEFVCLKGTWGCGKSRAALMAANDECENNPNNLYLIIRKEWVDLRDSTLHDWATWIGRPIDGEKNVKYSNGSVLMFRHGDDLNALKNVNLGGALMVQGEEMSEEDFWFLKGRMRRLEGTRQIRVECNYDGHNWIYKLFNEQKIGKLITTNTFDNEKNLPPDYIAGLKKLPEKIQRRHLYGSDEEMEGAVWDEFKESKHLIDPFEVPVGWDKLLVLDHGVTNPTAAIWGAIDWDGKLFIIDEHYEAGKTISYHAEQIQKRLWLNIKRQLIDPSCLAKTLQHGNELHSIVDEYRDNGLSFQPADNTVLAGINRVNEAFKNDKIFIFKTCSNLIREIQGYKWKKLKYTDTKNQPDEPLKKDDHACLVGDTEVLMADMSSKRIDNINIGEFVQTSNGIQKVIDSRLTGIYMQVKRVTFSNGKEIIATGNHQVYTSNGKISVDALRYCDIIEVWNKSYLKDRNTIGMVSIIHQLADVLTGASDFMWRSGKTLMALPRLVCAYITLMATRLIMSFQILPQLLCQSTLQTIPERTLQIQNIVSEINYIWSESARLQRNGIVQKRDLNGTASMEKKCGKIENLLRRFAYSAEKYFRVKTEQANTVATITNQGIAGNIKQTLNKGLVSSAKAFLVSINTLLRRPVHIVAVVNCNLLQSVYNLTIENTHNFFANGILVSNCDCLRYMVMSRYEKTTLEEPIEYPEGSAMGKAKALKRREEYTHAFIH